MDKNVKKVDVLGMWLEEILKKYDYKDGEVHTTSRATRIYPKGDFEGGRFGVQISPRGDHTMVMELFGPLYSRNNEYERHIIKLGDPTSLVEAEQHLVNYFIFMERWKEEHEPRGR